MQIWDIGGQSIGGKMVGTLPPSAPPPLRQALRLVGGRPLGYRDLRGAAKVTFAGRYFSDFENKKTHKIKLEGLASRVFQHEYDHMEGIDFTQRT